MGRKEKRIVDARIIERIFEVLAYGIKNHTEKSYVSRLNCRRENAVLQKIGEETVELILATKDNRSEEIVHEATDVFFHILGIFAQKGFELTGIFEELERRHQAKT